MYLVESDLTSVWVQSHGECVARFGKVAYEVFGTSDPRELIHFGRVADVESWVAFKERVLEVHGVTIGDEDTPFRFHKELELKPGYDSGDAASTFMIPVASIAELNNPFEADVWGRGRVTRQRVRQCIERGEFAADFVPMGMREMLADSEADDWDCRRIAYFVANPTDWPISIEVISLDGDYRLDDGWHRLAAAIFRNDETICVNLGGYVDGWDCAFPYRTPVGASEPDIGGPPIA